VEKPANTDGDDTIDALDSDSDDDGVSDSIEAGDTDLTTPPADENGDGLPDYRDPHTKGNGAGGDDILLTGGCACTTTLGEQNKTATTSLWFGVLGLMTSIWRRKRRIVTA
jgi:hypothetical protein